MNTISKEAVDKLQLPTEKHPKPYRVARFNDYYIPINHQCLVPFKIGIYEDSVWCGVIQMNTTYSTWSTLLHDHKFITNNWANAHLHVEGAQSSTGTYEDTLLPQLKPKTSTE